MFLTFILITSCVSNKKTCRTYGNYISSGIYSDRKSNNKW